MKNYQPELHFSDKVSVMKTTIKLLLIALIFLLGSQVLAGALVPTWYLGGWEYQSCDDKNITCLVKDFSFNKDGTYAIDAYPPVRHRGHYKVNTLTETEAVLNLSHQTGDWSPWKPQIKLVWDSAKQTMTIDGEGPYHKYLNVKTNYREPNEQ
ncbi:MAG: hypothetical protein ACD_73C00326G0001 [uncultured bacterium]|nr:MAG: hypothetical protein ACD_73C00326G0001 [uncultured bacterium]